MTEATTWACSGSTVAEGYASYDVVVGQPLGYLECNLDGNVAFTDDDAGNTADFEPFLLHFTANTPGEMPAFKCGDYLTVTNQGGASLNVYLPPNTSLGYGTEMWLWVDGTGGTLYANPAGFRNEPLPGQTYGFAFRNDDWAVRSGTMVYNFRKNALASSYNYIGVAYCQSIIGKASTLANVAQAQNGTPAFTTVSRWNNISQSFSIFAQEPFPFGDFNITPGQALQVEAKLTGTYTNTGAIDIGGYTYTLNTTLGSDFSYILLSPNRGDITTAHALALDIEANASPAASVWTIAKWENISQSFTQHIVHPPFPMADNFNITPGEVYRVEVNTTTTYTTH